VKVTQRHFSLVEESVMALFSSVVATSLLAAAFCLLLLVVSSSLASAEDPELEFNYL